jgi:tetratricopeptide (TPR) repeat protein
MRNNYNNIDGKIKSFILVLALTLAGACSEFIKLDPPKTQIVPQAVFQTAGSASSTLLGIYSLMMTNTSFTRGAIEEYLGTSSDELINYATNANRLQFYQNSLTAINGDVLSVFWAEAYKYISNTNMILEGLMSSPIPAPERNPLMGEALIVRTFCYFYLVNLYGDVPYLTTSSYQVNSQAPRTSSNEILINMVNDLITARGLMPNSVAAAGKRVRPGRDVATALLARIYLQQQEWEKAEEMATELITKSNEYSLSSDLTKVFLANSKEAIWQLMPVTPSSGTPQASLFILTNTPNSSSRRVSLRPELMAAFETGDGRKTAWTKTFTNASGSWNYSYKYTTTNAPVEYSMIFRFAEQYLIRAEARVQLGLYEEAKQDINIIRSRAGLNSIVTTDQTMLLKAILQERRIEFMTEFGHRWLDLKRMGVIDDVLPLLKANWQTTDAWFPIPEAERLINTNLSQNPGY